MSKHKSWLTGRLLDSDGFETYDAESGNTRLLWYEDIGSGLWIEALASPQVIERWIINTTHEVLIRNRSLNSSKDKVMALPNLSSPFHP